MKCNRVETSDERLENVGGSFSIDFHSNFSSICNLSHFWFAEKWGSIKSIVSRGKSKRGFEYRDCHNNYPIYLFMFLIWWKRNKRMINFNCIICITNTLNERRRKNRDRYLTRLSLLGLGYIYRHLRKICDTSNESRWWIMNCSWSHKKVGKGIIR